MSSPAAAPLPVGFRFRPTDEELVRHYLKPKIAGSPHPDLLFIPDVDLSACEPWELPAKALIKSDDPEWFFFAPLDRKYPGGHRSNRSTAAGYWKATGKDRLIRSRPAGTLIGVKKTLVYHRGRAPRGRRTAWIMHEYRTAEPQLQQGKNGSFVLYRLFNKQEEETPGSNLEDADSPSTSSPGPDNPVMKSENLAPLRTPVDNNDPTAPQENDPLLDVLAYLPDLQPDQTYNGFPTITSPMRPYTDHPFLGNAGEQHLSAYFSSIIAHQDLGETFGCTTGEAEAILVPSSSSNDKFVDDTGAAHCSSGTKILQKDTGDVNHGIGAKNDSVYSASAHVSHLYKKCQLRSNSAEMEPPNIAAQFSADSRTPYPQQLFNSKDSVNEPEGWVAEPMMQQFAVSNLPDPQQGTAARRQQFAVSNLPDPQQGTAARRIRLLHSVQRATVTEPVLTSSLESEDEAVSSYNTSNSSITHDKDYANLVLQITDGEATHVQDGGLLPTQVVSSVEVTESSQDFSFHEHISLNAKQTHEVNLKHRLKQENTRTSQDVLDGLTDSGRMPREPSYRRQQRAPVASVVWLICLALVATLAFVCLWKSSLWNSLH